MTRILYTAHMPNTKEPHAFAPNPSMPRWCAVCEQGADEEIHLPDATHVMYNGARAPSVDSVPKPGRSAVLVAMPADLMNRIDNFRFERRFPSRAAAIRSLLHVALKIGDGVE